MKSILAVGALALALISPAHATMERYDHNGSVMVGSYARDGSAFEITYDEPRPSLWSVVRPGTVLVHGRWYNSHLEATAYIFKLHCGPVPYHVSGAWEGGRLILDGPVPVTNSWCAIVG